MEDRKEWCDMSNLGGYQWLTTSAKKVGGPVNLVLLIAGSGAAIYKGGEVLVKNSVKAIKKIRVEKKVIAESSAKIYCVSAQGVSNEGLAFAVGDKFKVLESDGDAVLIEKIGDLTNPYFVSAELLKDISDYKN